MIKIQRRRYLVKKGMQFRYVSLVALPLVTLLSGLYYLIYYSVFNEMLIPEAITVTLLPAMKKVNVALVVALPILLFIILRIALIYSHRIAGPIPRIERELDRAIAGGHSIRIKLRDKDELTSVIDRVNRLLENLEKASAA